MRRPQMPLLPLHASEVAAGLWGHLPCPFLSEWHEVCVAGGSSAKQTSTVRAEHQAPRLSGGPHLNLHFSWSPHPLAFKRGGKGRPLIQEPGHPQMHDDSLAPHEETSLLVSGRKRTAIQALRLPNTPHSAFKNGRGLNSACPRGRVTGLQCFALSLLSTDNVE